jgi:hypothetical protein
MIHTPLVGCSEPEELFLGKGQPSLSGEISELTVIVAHLGIGSV